jgi:hypothetical protein
VLDQSDVAWFQDGWPALLECASPLCNTQRLAELLRGVDWRRLFARAEQHGVLGQLALRLGEVAESALPAEVAQGLLERHRAQVFSTLKLTAALFHVLELFAAKDIPGLVVKGPVLAIHAYGDPAMRSYGDLDLLVRQSDIRRATESLRAAGYLASIPLSAIDGDRIPGQYLFSKPDDHLIVELHNDFTLRYFPRRLPLEELFDRRVLVRLDAYEVPALAVEDELVYVCVHGATHLWDRLSWIADIAALVTRQTDMDWHRVRETATKVGAERMLHAGLYLASDLLHARLPNPVLAAMQRDAGATKLAACARTWLSAAGDATPTLFDRTAFRLRMRGNALRAPAYLLRLSLSPTEEDWKQGYPESRHSFFDALRRPFRLARKYGRRRNS